MGVAIGHPPVLAGLGGRAPVAVGALFGRASTKPSSSLEDDDDDDDNQNELHQKTGRAPVVAGALFGRASTEPSSSLEDDDDDDDNQNELPQKTGRAPVAAEPLLGRTSTKPSSSLEDANDDYSGQVSTVVAVTNAVVSSNDNQNELPQKTGRAPVAAKPLFGRTSTKPSSSLEGVNDDYSGQVSTVVAVTNAVVSSNDNQNELPQKTGRAPVAVEPLFGRTSTKPSSSLEDENDD
jgi:hypothetical protein